MTLIMMMLFIKSLILINFKYCTVNTFSVWVYLVVAALDSFTNVSVNYANSLIPLRHRLKGASALHDSINSIDHDAANPQWSRLSGQTEDYAP